MTASRGHRSAEVVVVGAGAIGLAVALQLRRIGIDDVLVVDRNPSPGMGSTSRANGGVRAQFSTSINIEFSRHTIHELADLDIRTGGQVGFRRVGYLFMAGAEPGVRALRHAYEVQRSAGLDVEWLSPPRALEIAPFANPTGLSAATYCPGDGIIDPHGVVSALWSEARSLGVQWVCDAEIVAMDRRRGRTRLLAAGAEIEATHVVNAAGPQARALAALAGLDLPVTPYRRNLACTEPVAGPPDAIPMCVDVDTGVLIRREGGGFLIAYSDPRDLPCSDTGFDPGFLDAVAERIGNRFAFLEGVPINPRKCWAGLYPETPDHHAIVDAPEAAPWFIQCAGFGGHGIMHCMAAGLAAAELVRDGRCPSFDLRPLRADRFGGATVVETAVL
jgi:sarcosine oxidase subunit beta